MWDTEPAQGLVTEADSDWTGKESPSCAETQLWSISMCWWNTAQVATCSVAERGLPYSGTRVRPQHSHRRPGTKVRRQDSHSQVLTLGLHQPESGISLPPLCRGPGVCIRRGRARSSDQVTSQMTDNLLKCCGSPAQRAHNSIWVRMGKPPRGPFELNLKEEGGKGLTPGSGSRYVGWRLMGFLYLGP